MSLKSYCPLRQDSCRPADCAWWDETGRACAVLLLAQRFDAVTTSDDELAVKSDQTIIFDLREDDSCSHT